MNAWMDLQPRCVVKSSRGSPVMEMNNKMSVLQCCLKTFFTHFKNGNIILAYKHNFQEASSHEIQANSQTSHISVNAKKKTKKLCIVKIISNSIWWLVSEHRWLSMQDELTSNMGSNGLLSLQPLSNLDWF